MNLMRELYKAKRNGDTTLTVSVEDVERLISQKNGMDQLLAKCMDKLSKEDYNEIFGDMFKE